MGAEKLNHSLETMQQIKDSWQDFGDEANEETLSLCDLVMSSDSNEFWNDFSKEDQQSNNGDLFEFFSEDFPAAAASTYPENNNDNIIFCGKLISYKENQSNFEDKSQSLNCKIKQENDEKKKNISSSSCLFPWKMSSHSFNKSRTFPSSKSAKESRGKSFNKSLSMPVSGSKNNYGKFGGENKKLGDERFDFSVKKVSILATPVKSRWYLFAFGVGRFPTEIELKDMKMRQSRKSKAMKFQAPGGSGCGGSGPENVKGDKERRRSAKGLWRLLKVLAGESRI